MEHQADSASSLPVRRHTQQILEEMENLANQVCGEVDPKDIPNLFDKALWLMLEARLPREPEYPKELSVMLDRAIEGPFQPWEAARKKIKDHSEAFAAWIKQQRDLTSQGSWNSAATRLAPSGEPGAPKWRNGPYHITINMKEEGPSRTTIRHAGDKVEGQSKIAGLATVAAIMRAHVKWHGIWKR